MDMMEMMDDQDGRDVFFFSRRLSLSLSLCLSVCWTLLNLSLPRHGPIIRIEKTPVRCSQQRMLC